MKGDLSLIQMTALAWLMANEIEEQSDLDRSRMEFEALVANQAINPKLIKALFKDEDEENVEWITPRSESDIHEILSTWRTIAEQTTKEP